MGHPTAHFNVEQYRRKIKEEDSIQVRQLQNSTAQHGTAQHATAVKSSRHAPLAACAQRSCEQEEQQG